MMILVGFIALLAAVAIQSMRVAQRGRELARFAALLDDYRRAADRVAWTERMYKKGYVSKAQLDVERVSFKNAQSSLGLQE
jgi:hypothetical protein